MTDIEFILERLRANEETAQKFYRVETKFLSILNFNDFFDVLLSEIQEEFSVSHAWISIIKKSELSKLIKSLGASDTLKEHLKMIDRTAFKALVGDITEPTLANGNLEPYTKLFPRKKKYDIKSIAVSPISFGSDIAGSLNLADVSESRFKPGLDTSYLEHLAVKVSLCLSNVVAHEKLKSLAYHDPLTGLLNRRVMEDVLKREFIRAIRYKNSLSVVFIDLDDFKKINDTYGHDRGDDLLKHAAKKMVKMCRKTDVVSRFAGDEFVIILPETSSENAERLISRLTDDLWKYPLKRGGTVIPLSVSYGVASTEEKSIKGYRQLLKAADRRLLKAKKKKGEASDR
ncbi:MAG: sensor domain-containing diguanylate cyclase [Deltaproteobacteria bacterium]|nr:sensor domain-containing diguanylate cyclase [Deltaproteobacteria bacterium]